LGFYFVIRKLVQVLIPFEQRWIPFPCTLTTQFRVLHYPVKGSQGLQVSQSLFRRHLQVKEEFFSLFYANLIASFKYGSDIDGILFKRLKLSIVVYIGK
jgi:hypothetical protein